MARRERWLTLPKFDVAAYGGGSAQQKAALRRLGRTRGRPQSTRAQRAVNRPRIKPSASATPDRFKRFFLHPRFRRFQGPAWRFAHKARLVGETVSHMAGAVRQFVDTLVRRGGCALHRAARRVGHLVDAAVKRRPCGFNAALDGVVVGGRCCGFVHDASFKKIPQNTGVALPMNCSAGKTKKGQCPRVDSRRATG
jgi:hypothetical protein